MAVVLKKQEISQQVTRMQDLASEFSKFSEGDTSGLSQREGDGRPPPAPNTAFGKRSTGVGTHTLVPSNFQP